MNGMKRSVWELEVHTAERTQHRTSCTITITIIISSSSSSSSSSNTLITEHQDTLSLPATYSSPTPALFYHHLYYLLQPRLAATHGARRLTRFVRSRAVEHGTNDSRQTQEDEATALGLFDTTHGERRTANVEAGQHLRRLQPNNGASVPALRLRFLLANTPSR
ncbi:hypothetical protein K490DRAFT_55294 [Saccharata proteae CBS 121410]|uniref:Uncharacterized protein n=1 Tax=Saccharata proteae CBS 121410 TaxID=1314787 RepID=A0A6A5YDE7_9PEZI|nr:hypothetical protein K490DRAFT_55294 [Saccharata proteae CBS 121410]